MYIMYNEFMVFFQVSFCIVCEPNLSLTIKRPPTHVQDILTTIMYHWFNYFGLDSSHFQVKDFDTTRFGHVFLFWQGVSSNDDIQMQKMSSTSVNCKFQETYQLTYTPTLSDDNSLVTCVAKQASGNEIVSDATTLHISELKGTLRLKIDLYIYD